MCGRFKQGREPTRHKREFAVLDDLSYEAHAPRLVFEHEFIVVRQELLPWRRHCNVLL
jgi:hypothetical protein